MTSHNDSDPDQGAADGDGMSNGAGGNEAVPKPKRIACILCRKRKLRCDGGKPSCGTCARLNHHCEYSEERKKSGPKRGYVKLLEARLKQVENLLETRDTPKDGPSDPPPPPAAETAPRAPAREGYHGMSQMEIPILADSAMSGLMPENVFADSSLGMGMDFSTNPADDISWEMIGLGLEEALPTREVVDELNEIYFDKIHPSLPMIHKARFLASMDLAPHMRPAVCLRYAMWTHACVITPKYAAYTEHFYARARKYAEMDEMRGHGEGMITIAHSQAWTLLACYEFKLMYFPRAWMSIGRAARLAQMMGLHRQDRVGLDVKQTLPPPRDWTEREERRRTFWMAYCQDRYASIGTGWPMVIDEKDILTNLPASEDAFTKSLPEPVLQLSDVINGEGISNMSPFAGIILLSTLYGRNLTHLHRPEEHDNDHDLNGAFWKRHRNLDNILLNTSLSLPAQLRLPAGLNDPNIVFLNMNIHTATICLHQAAIFKADRNRLPAQISAESKRRCIVAADQITNFMKMISHVDMALMNPFLAFCLYVAARVFVQYLKARREDAAVKSSLHFLLAAMQVLKTKNPLTESFLVQLDVDLEGSGLDIPNSHTRWKFGHRPPGESPANTDSLKCSPLFEVADNQAQQYSATGSNAVPPPWPQDAAAKTKSSFPSLYGDAGAGAPPHQTTASLNQDPFNNIHTFSAQSLTSDTSPNASHPDSSRSRSLSNHPTPSTVSNQNSSNTSFTPPQNQSVGGSTSNTSNHNVQSPDFPYTATSTFNTMGESTLGQPMSDLPTNMNFSSTGLTPGPTGMTPLQDASWPMDGLGDGTDWMFTWPGSTPQPQ